MITPMEALKVSQLLASLVKLNTVQQDMIEEAKKYAQDLSIKNILNKQSQSAPINQQQTKANQRYQALLVMCRVYVGSISFEVKTETLKAAFGLFGAVKSFNLSWDQTTQKHKGFAFVEYEIPEAAHLAIENLNGVLFGGRNLRVDRPANQPQVEPLVKQMQEEIQNLNRVYVTAIDERWTKSDLVSLFEPFGSINECSLPMIPSSNPPSHRGYAFLEFDSAQAASEALMLDNTPVGSMILRLCRATTPPEHISPHGILTYEGFQPIVAQAIKH